MFTTDQDSGLFTFMVGMIILVMVGVGLSLVIDKRLKFSSGQGETQIQIRAETAELSELTTNHQSRSRLLAESTETFKNSGKLHGELLAKLELLQKRKNTLIANRASVKEDIGELEQDFSEYRDSYRARTWSRAVGEKLGDLRLSGGREYHDCAITKVTDAGLEIRHENGFARIQAPDLDGKLRDRFQWNDDQRRKLLDAEQKLHEANAEDSSVAATDEDSDRVHPGRGGLRSVRAEGRQADKDSEKLGELRFQVSGWNAKVSKLKAERAEAVIRSSSNSRGSVPGSLETWKQRSVRVSQELLKARSELEIARGRLRAVSPSDRALEVVPDKDE